MRILKTNKMENKDTKLKATPFNAPENYFQDLETRLSSIASTEQSPRKSVKITRYIAPAVSLAASFALLLGIGTYFLNKTNPAELDFYDTLSFAELIPTLSDETAIYSQADYEASAEEIAEYLIYTGTTLEEINY